MQVKIANCMRSSRGNDSWLENETRTRRERDGRISPPLFPLSRPFVISLLLSSLPTNEKMKKKKEMVTVFFPPFFFWPLSKHGSLQLLEPWLWKWQPDYGAAHLNIRWPFYLKQVQTGQRLPPTSRWPRCGPGLEPLHCKHKRSARTTQKGRGNIFTCNHIVSRFTITFFFFFFRAYLQRNHVKWPN